MLTVKTPIQVKTAMRIAGFVILSLMLADVSFGQIKSGVIEGTVLDSGVGTYTNSNTYDGRQLELAAEFKFWKTPELRPGKHTY
jgi:hypothetical protein